MPSLLVADRARIEENGVVLADEWSFAADGTSVALLGDWTPLFRLCSRTALLAQGSIRVLDRDAETGAAERRLGIAVLHAPLPLRWRAVEYLEASARLLGVRGRARNRAAIAALDALGLGALRKQAIGNLGLAERRALGIAHATLGSPAVLLLDRPFDDLTDLRKAWLADVIDRAVHGRCWIGSERSLPVTGVERSLFARTDQVVVVAEGRVTAAGPPADVLGRGQRCVLEVARSLGALSAALEERGLPSERLSAPDDAEDAGRLAVALPDGVTTSVVVEAAVAAEAPLFALSLTVPDPGR